MKSINFLKSGLIMLVMVMVISCQNDIDEIVENDEKCVDIDGNIYSTITIGDQVWMTEVLRTTKYRNGDPIATTEPLSQSIVKEAEPKYYWHYPEAFGIYECTYYTWYAMADERQIAPVGWRIPTYKELWQLAHNSKLYEFLPYGYRCVYSSNLYNPSFNEVIYGTSSEVDEKNFKSVIINKATGITCITKPINKAFGFPIICVKDKE